MSDQAEAGSPFERHPVLTGVLFLGAVALGLDFAAGTAYSLVTGHAFYERPQALAAEAYEEEQHLYRVASARYDHDLRPGVSLDGVAWGGLRYDIRTNSLGFKDRQPRTVPMEADRRRLLFIGDSFTEGVGFSYEHTFVGIVDSALAPAGVEVLNAAVSSYSPLIYWRKLAYWIGERGLEVDEVVVYIDISDAYNDAELYTLAADGSVQHAEDHDAGAPVLTRPQGSGRLGWLKDALKYNTVVIATLAQLKDRTAPRGGEGNFPIDNELSRWTIHDSTWEAYGREGVRRMSAHMDSLHALLSARGIPLTVAVYPWPDQVAAGDLDSRQVRVWREWTATRGAGFVNHFPALVRGETHGERWDVLRRYYIDGDSHWNAAGHRLIAEGFLDAYRDRRPAVPAR